MELLIHCFLFLLLLAVLHSLLPEKSKVWEAAEHYCCDRKKASQLIETRVAKRKKQQQQQQRTQTSELETNS